MLLIISSFKGRRFLLRLVGFATVVVVGVGFEVVVMVVREMREDKFEPDFDDHEGDDEADVGFKVDFGDKVEQGGN